MWNRFFVLQILITLFTLPNPSSSSTNLPPFTKVIGRIKEKKYSGYCTSTNIKFTSKWNKKLQILDLQSCDGSLEVITKDLPKILNDSPSLFVVSVKMEQTDKDFESRVRDVLEVEVTRPTVVNFFNKLNKTENFYVFDRSKTRIQTNKSLEYAEEFINTVINFDYDSGDSPFKKHRSNILKEAMNNGCSLCIYFAQLIDSRFVWYLKIQEKHIDDLKCDIDCFRALLNFPHDFDFDSSYGDVFKLLFSYYIELIKDSFSEAARIGDEYTVRDYLRENEIDMDMDGLAGLAWKEREFKVFEFLIKADLPYPRNFLEDRAEETTSDPAVENVISYIQEVEVFHRHIKKGNFNRVKSFVSQNKHLAFARNIDNKSALKVASECNQMEIFSYLRSQGMSFGSFKEVGEYYKTKSKFKETNKKQLRQFNRKFLTPAIEVDLVTKLMQKSLFTHDQHVHDEKQIRHVIKRSYEKIKGTAMEILEIAAASNELQILFDFANSDLTEFDPYMNDAHGVAYYDYDFVIVAAKDLLSDDVDKKNYALGTLSHELMHYTMHQMYQNSINPYDENDHERREIIMKIYKKYRKIRRENFLIETAYKDDEEEDDDKYGELIARVPDILFTYKDNQTYLAEVKEKFRDLFKFYDQYVLADMREIIPTIHNREKIRELNNWLDLVAEIQSYDLSATEDTETDDSDENQVESQKSAALKQETDSEELLEVTEIVEFLKKDTKQRLKVVKTENPKMVLQKLYYKLRMSKILAIYVASSFTYYGNFNQVMNKFDTIHPSVPLIINCDRIKRLNRIVKMMQSTTFTKVIAIADKSDFEEKVTDEELDEWIENTKF